MIKIVIADDHAIVREGLKQILADIPDMEVFGEAGSGDEVLKFIRDEGWNIMLLDIAMPGKNVLELIKLAKHQSPQLPVLILSMFPEDQYAIRMLRAGADGYLTKESAPEQLVSVIRKVAKGGKYISPTMAEKLIAELNPNQNKLPHTTLTDREFQVFRGICNGISMTALARHMALSTKTVSTYRSRLMIKMNMSTNAELIHYAIKNDLLD
jgi:two-component system, NarL family, invasion response regulator UvrY